MIMKRQDKIVVTAAIVLLAYTLSLSLLGPVVSSLQTNKTIASSGSVRAMGVGVYWNSNGTNPVTSLNWGMISPNSTESETCYIENTGNQTLTLSMSASSWSPANCTLFMQLSWNLTGATLSGGQTKAALFSLEVLPSVEGITAFSFDVTIVGSS
jgi:hypothetical protein